MRSSWVLLTVALVGALAHAEGVDSRQKLPDTPDRLHGVTTMVPMVGGGLVTLGGSSLRVLAPRARNFEVLHRQPGDNLYRVAVNDAGGVLAAWEKDPLIHYFTPAPRRHLTFPKPGAPAPGLRNFNLEHLAFLPNGRDALVRMEGTRNGRRSVNGVFRIALDGSGSPELLYQVDGGRLVHMTRDLAVYVLPRNPDQECENRTCDPVAAIVAYEVTENGVSRKTLLRGEEFPVGNARIVWGSDEAQVVLQLDLKRNERALLRWRRGDAKPELRRFSRASGWDEQLFLTRAGDVFQLVRTGKGLELRRHPPDGRQQAMTLPASSDPDDWDTTLYDVGVRSNGALWVHWGDYLLLFSSDPTKPPRAYSIEPLLTRRAEWAGVDIHLPNPEVLWVGIEVGRGRDFVRMSLADVEKRAKPWPGMQ